MPGDDWSREEVEATVGDYFAMLHDELAGLPINKAEHNERLRRLLDYRLITRSESEGFPLRVEYALTDPGRRVAALLAALQELNRELANEEVGRAKP